MVVELVAIGWNIEYTTDLPLPEFNALYEQAMAANLRWKIQDAFTTHLAAQGTTKQLKEHLKPLIEAASKRREKPNDTKKFLSDFKRGL